MIGKSGGCFQVKSQIIWRSVYGDLGLVYVDNPLCHAHKHLQWLTNSSISAAPDAPLFPNVNGAMVKKATMVVTFERLAEATGEPQLSEEDLRRYGGRSPRVTGARRFATLGIDQQDTTHCKALR